MASIQEGSGELSIEEGNITFNQYATVIDGGSSEEQIYNRLERLESCMSLLYAERSANPLGMIFFQNKYKIGIV